MMSTVGARVEMAGVPVDNPLILPRPLNLCEGGTTNNQKARMDRLRSPPIPRRPAR
jgi:hypothetical protein